MRDEPLLPSFPTKGQPGLVNSVFFSKDQLVHFAHGEVKVGKCVCANSGRLGISPNRGCLVRESPQNTLNSGLGIIVICLEIYGKRNWNFVKMESLFIAS